MHPEQRILDARLVDLSQIVEDSYVVGDDHGRPGGVLAELEEVAMALDRGAEGERVEPV